MKICTFFGHRDCPEMVRPAIRAAIIRLIEEHGIREFYVGHQGGFDRMVRGVLRELATVYPHMGYTIVLAYLPQKNDPSFGTDASRTLLPEGIENVPPRFAISFRNRWMLKQADFVIAYVSHPWGNAAALVKSAVHQHKCVINLAPTSCIDKPPPQDVQ